MTIVREQSKSGSAQGYAAAFSVSLTMDSIPTEGNYLIAVVAYNGGSSSVASIVQSNVTWSLVIAKSKFWAAWGWDLAEIWIGVVGSGASTGATVNITNVGTTYHACCVTIAEYSGLTGVTDKTASNAATVVGTTTDTGTTDTTTVGDELWIGVVDAKAQLINQTSLTHSNPTNGFTLVLSQYILCVAWGWGCAEGFLEKIVSSTGTANSGTTLDKTSSWLGAIATFKAPVVLKGAGSIIIQAKVLEIV